MNKEDAVKLLCEHFSEGMVRTIMDALKQEQGEPKEWLSLTDEEIEKEWFKTFNPEPGIGKNITNGVFDFANSIEAKLKEKNGY